MKLARFLIAASLCALGVGTISGSSPSWPNQTVYAVCAFGTAAVWLILAFRPVQHEGKLAEWAWSALLALAIIRGVGYVIDLVDKRNLALAAAVSAWAIISVLSSQPLRRHHVS